MVTEPEPFQLITASGAKKHYPIACQGVRCRTDSTQKANSLYLGKVFRVFMTSKKALYSGKVVVKCIVIGC